MSGNMDMTCQEERQRRYDRMLQMINNNSAVPSISGSMYDFKLGQPVSVNTTQQQQNSVIPPQLFYKPAPIQNTNSFVNPTPSNSDQTAYTQSEASMSVFRVPQTSKQYSAWMHYKMEIDIMVSLLQTIQDKERLKFLVRLFKNAIHIVHHQQFPMSNPSSLLDTVSNAVKNKYYSGIPKSIGCSSVVSDSQSSRIEYPRVALNDFNSQQLSKSRTAEQLFSPPSIINVVTQKKPIENATIRSERDTDNTNINMEESCTELFTESQIAQRRDENLIQSYNDLTIQYSQELEKCKTTSRKRLPKATPMPTKARAVKTNNSNESKKVSTPKTKQRAEKKNNRVNNSLKPSGNTPVAVPSTAKGLSLRGRPIKSPKKFWQGNESKLHNVVDKRRLSEENKATFNDSMMLRSCKVVDRKTPTLPESQQNTTPLDTTANDTIKPKARGRVNKSKTIAKENKENVQQPKPSKTTKKADDTKKSKVISDKKEKPSKKVESKPNKAVSNKRKSEELDGLPLSKKTKASLQESDVMSSDDELFGAVSYKKKSKPALQALSPTSGIQSAKKAVGMLISKETPPCKTLGLLMNSSSTSAVSTVVKEAPVAKKNQAVKRVTKIIENNKTSKSTQSKLNKIKPQQEKGKNNKIVEEFKSYTTTTPLTTATLSMMMGTEVEDYEESDDEYDDCDLQ